MNKFNLGDKVQFSQYGISYTGIVTQFSWYSGISKEHTYKVRIQRPDTLGCEMQYWEANFLEGELTKVESEHSFANWIEEVISEYEAEGNIGFRNTYADSLRPKYLVVPEEYHSGCQHEFVEYVGLVQKFNYCKKCDQKQ